jgi:integrase
MNRQTWKPATTASFWATCKSYFEWAKERGLRSDNPMDGVRPVKVPPSPPKIASAQALQEAIEKASRRDRLALMLAAYAGLRRAEVAGLHASMIEDGWIRVEGKGKKVRRVPIHPDLAGELKRARDMGGYLFPGRDGDGPISPDSMGKRMGRLLPPGVSAHHLRHMFATSAYRHSHDIRAVQQLLGHSSLATTQIYVSSNDDELMAAVFGIGAA